MLINYNYKCFSSTSECCCGQKPGDLIPPDVLQKTVAHVQTTTGLIFNTLTLPVADNLHAFCSLNEINPEMNSFLAHRQIFPLQHLAAAHWGSEIQKRCPTKSVTEFVCFPPTKQFSSIIIIFLLFFKINIPFYVKD